MALDIQLLYLLNNLAGQSPFLDKIIVFLASYLAYFLAALFLALLFFSHYPKQEKIRILLVTAVSTAIARFGATELIRLFYHRPRPFSVLPIHHLLTDTAWSFPSGHATFFFALATVVYLYHRAWGIVFFIGALGIVISRVIAGVHYPTDIAVGATIGMLVACGVVGLVRSYK